MYTYLERIEFPDFAEVNFNDGGTPKSLTLTYDRLLFKARSDPPEPAISYENKVQQMLLPRNSKLEIGSTC